MSTGAELAGESARAAGSVRAAGSMSCEPRLCVAGANPCEHAGKCINTQGSFQCQCLQGYSGPRCEIDVNECLSNPCQNDATCLDQIGEFQCICMPGERAALPWCWVWAVGGLWVPLSFSSALVWVRSHGRRVCLGAALRRKSLVKIARSPAAVGGQEVRVEHHQPCSGFLLFPTLQARINPRAGRSGVDNHGAACASGPTTCRTAPGLSCLRKDGGTKRALV